MKTSSSFAFLLLLIIGIVACNPTQQIKDGRLAIEQKQYASAIPLLKKEYNKAKSRIEKGKIAYALGTAYEQIQQAENAVDWYTIAYDSSVGIEALEGQARSLKKLERYKEAAVAYKELGLELGSPFEYRREIKACENAALWKTNPYPEHKVELATLNSRYSDYSPFIFQEELIFTSDRPNNTNDKTYHWTGNYFSDLYSLPLNTSSASPLSDLNTATNEGTLVYSTDGQEAFFTRCDGTKKEDAFCKIMYARQEGGAWQTPEMLPFQEKGINYGQPALSTDGKTLYFAAQHPDGWGGYDIWVSNRNGIDWSEPKLLGRSINTPGNEKFPTIDGDTLYFASDFHIGMGGLDIFKTYPIGESSWAPPLNMLPPINSGADDFGLVIDHNFSPTATTFVKGYFTSAREGGDGQDDIYTFEKVKVEKPPIDTTPIVYKMILEGFVLEKIYQNPTDPNSKVLGRKPLTKASVDVIIAGKKETIQLGEDGFFTFELSENTDYDFLASQEGYLTNTAVFSTQGMGKDPNTPIQTYEVTITLDRIFENQEIELENIYYDFDQWYIRDDAQPTLDELANILRLNPSINIELGSHTDCRGREAYNLNLSQKRAQSAVDYLSSKGISGFRLQARGYGESAPANDCNCNQCTDDEHQENRRTTFKIIEN